MEWSSECVSFQLLRDFSRRQLTDCLDKYVGNKVLVWDDCLTSPVDLVANFQFLKDRRVSKMFVLNPELSLNAIVNDKKGVDSIVFVARADMGIMDAIANVVSRLDRNKHSSSIGVELHLLLVPKQSVLCESRLRERTVLHLFASVDQWSLFFVPVDNNDLIDMQMPSLLKEYHVDEDSTSLFPVAQALMQLQNVYGAIPNVFGKGKAAHQLYEYVKQLEQETVGYHGDSAGDNDESSSTKIDNLILFDRSVDLISPLCTQLTYQGLIDELFHIEHNMVKLPKAKFLSAETPTEEETRNQLKSIPLRNDELFNELRDKSFNAVGPTLRKKARMISEQFEERHEAKTVRQLKHFVDKLPEMKQMKQSLATHTSIAELVKEATDRPDFLEALQVEQDLLNLQFNADRVVDFIEDTTAMADNERESFLRLLRLISIHSVVNSGLKPKVLNSYRRSLLHAFGFKHLLSLYRLEKIGLLRPQDNTNRSYAVLRKRLRLTVNEVDEQNPSDIAYVHSLFAPLSVRLLSLGLQADFKGNDVDDVFELLPGPFFRQRRKFSKKKKTSLIVFIGGCTYAEVAALRFCNNEENSNGENGDTRYLIATTAMLSGNTLVESLLDPLEDNIEKLASFSHRE